MHAFFNGWRRTTGCVALVMALAVMAAWLRSYVVYDWVTFWLQESGQSALSQCGCVVWQNRCRPNPSNHFRGIEIGWESTDADRPALGIETHLDNYLILAPTDSTSEWSWSGFYFGATSDANGLQRTWIISHSLLLLPLTLLSAYLILWKPRPKPKGKPNA